MSLSALLLGGSKPDKVVDTDLDALFRSNVGTGSWELENVHVDKEPVNDVESSDEEIDPSQLIHESVAKHAGKGSRNRKSKYIPENETANQRDRRTVFVGNLSVEVAQKRVRVMILWCLYRLNPGIFSPYSSNSIVTSYRMYRRPKSSRLVSDQYPSKTLRLSCPPQTAKTTLLKPLKP